MVGNLDFRICVCQSFDHKGDNSYPLIMFHYIFQAPHGLICFFSILINPVITANYILGLYNLEYNLG